MRARAWLLAIEALVALSACHPAATDSRARAAASASASASVVVDRGVLAQAEIRRDSSAIGEAALSSRDATVRREAVRALARIADARASELLALALADEDGDVVTWSAYGLGYACKGREAKTVRALTARAASLDDSAQARAPLASPSVAIADALGRCGGSEAESTLRAWLEGATLRAEASALALGRIASHTGRLDDATVVALLNAADRPQNPLSSALYACSRLAALNESTESRVREIAARSIATKGAGTEFAVRALAHAGAEGASAVGALLADTTQSALLRAEATRELTALGPSSQATLWSAFDKLPLDKPTDADLLDATFGPTSALVAALAPPISSSGAKLQALTDLPIADADSPTLKRRKIQLRCAAAALLAGSNPQSQRLMSCDPAKESRARTLGVIAVLGRDKIRGARKQTYVELTRSTDVVVREAALALLGAHGEVPEAFRLLAEALGAKSLGVVASAASVLTAYPERAARAPEPDGAAHAAPNPDPSVVQALTGAYAAAAEQHNVEVQSLLLDATGALQILSLKPAVNEACISTSPTLREHAEKSLRLLGEQSRRCDKATPDPSAHPSPAAAATTELTFETEAGTLSIELDATYAPNAVARIATLSRAGFYDGLAVHRVVPGFVAQFGDPAGDGYGSDTQPPLRCETSPIAFDAGSVGVALGGRDTGSSQLFVTLGRYPHLDGEYAWLGRAGAGWEKVAPGDRILHVKVADLP